MNKVGLDWEDVGSWVPQRAGAVRCRGWEEPILWSLGAGGGGGRRKRGVKAAQEVRGGD